MEQFIKQQRQVPRSLKATNGALTLKLVSREPGISQQIAMADSGTPLLDAAGGDILLRINGQSLRLTYDQARVVDIGKDHAKLHCRISRPQYEIATIYDLLPDGNIDVTTTFSPRTNSRLTSIEHRYAFVPSLQQARRQASPLWDYLWQPNLKHRRSHLVGQHGYRSPAVIIQKGGAYAALVPQLAYVKRDMLLPAAMDFQRPGVLRCGLVAHKTVGHTYYQRESRRSVYLQPGQSVRFGFTILAGEDAAERMATRSVARFLWARYGNSAENQVLPQAAYFDDFARYAYDNFTERYGLWRPFDLDGRPVGGISVRVNRPHLAAGGTPHPPHYVRRVLWQVLASPALPLGAKLSVLSDALRGSSRSFFYGVRFNNLRTAYGMAHYGGKWGDSGLSEAADRIVNMVLSAPAEEGLLPLAFVGSPRRPAWLKGARPSFLSSHYSTAAMSESGLWMLAYQRDFAGPPELLERGIGLGEAFLRVQNEQGAIPAWIQRNSDGSLKAVGPLGAGATTAAAGRYLTRLARATGKEVYLETARRAADFIIRHVWPKQEWHDFETFYSCSARPLSFRDAESQLTPQSTLALSWAADLLSQVYDLTAEESYLAFGKAILDVLLLFQQVWDAPFLSYHTFGGFGVMNTDAAWSDARQAIFVPLLCDYYDFTGEPEYLERAIAALRASFVMMHTPENAAQAPRNHVGVTEADFGAMPANYGHGGLDRKNGGHLYPDWGSGSACTAAAVVQRRYGDLFVDARRGRAFGINGCRVLRAHVSIRVIDLLIERLPPYDDPPHRRPLDREIARGTIVKCVDLPAEDMSLWVNNNDLGLHSAEAFRAGIPYYPPQVLT